MTAFDRLSAKADDLCASAIVCVGVFVAIISMLPVFGALMEMLP